MFEYVFDDPGWFKLLVLLPLLWAVYAAKVIWMRKKQRQFASSAMLRRIAPARSTSKITLRYILYSLVIILLTFALVNPKIGVSTEQVKRQGTDIVFALDVSRSMLAEDIAPSRLEKARQLISRTIDELGGDRVGIIVYAGSAFPLLPITNDYSAAKMFLSTASPDMVSSQGTSIADAIRLTDRYFDDQTRQGRFLFILSDGEDHEEGAAEAARQVAQKGVVVHTIGIGRPEGGPIPIRKKGGAVSYKEDADGNVVVTRLEAGNLRRIAQEGGGSYISGASTKGVVDFIKETIAGGEKAEYGTVTVTHYKDRYQWFLGAAILLLLLDVFISGRRSRLLDRIDLFNEKPNP